MKLSQDEMSRIVEQEKIIVILRGLNAEQLLPTVEALEKGGIRMVEVTFDQSRKIPDDVTAGNIRMLAERFDGRIHIGAGTVMTVKQVELAHSAGAEYTISPDTFRDVIVRTKELGMLSIPGALTPTEAAMAHRYGADFVKLFPNSEFSVSYLKALAAPLSHIRFLSVGGINETNIAEYLAAGAKGVGVATNIVDKQAIAEHNYERITQLARIFTRAAGTKSSNTGSI